MRGAAACAVRRKASPHAVGRARQDRPTAWERDPESSDKSRVIGGAAMSRATGYVSRSAQIASGRYNLDRRKIVAAGGQSL